MNYFLTTEDDILASYKDRKTEEETLAIICKETAGAPSSLAPLEELFFSCSYTARSISYFHPSVFKALLAGLSLTLKSMPIEIAAYYVDLLCDNWNAFDEETRVLFADWLCQQSSVNKEQISELALLAPTVQFEKHANPIFTQKDISQALESFLPAFPDFIAKEQYAFDAVLRAAVLNPNFVDEHAEKIMNAFAVCNDLTFKALAISKVLLAKTLTSDFITKLYTDLSSRWSFNTISPLYTGSFARNSNTPTFVLKDLVKRFPTELYLLEAVLQNNNVSLEVIGHFSPVYLKNLGLQSFIFERCLESLKFTLFPSSVEEGRTFAAFATLTSELTFTELYKITKEIFKN